MEDLRVFLVQPDLVWEDKTRNTQQLYAMVQAVNDVDVIVLPELFSTGFSMDVHKLASPENNAQVAWMQQLAAEKKCCVTGSLMIEEGGMFYNRLFWVFPNGQYKTYNKRHLFSYAGEHKQYTAGKERLLVRYKGWAIMPLICYDLRFPVWSRNDVEYDLLVYVANWPARRSYPWQQLLKARAIENLSYVVGVNRVGNDGNGIAHSGDSAVIDPLGEVVCALSPSEAVTQVVTINKQHVVKTRQRFAFLNDRDLFKVTV